jgi:hypothetical protein
MVNSLYSLMLHGSWFNVPALPWRIAFYCRTFFHRTPLGLGTSAPSTWTRADSTGRYDLEFAASVALGLDSRSRASLPLRSRARVQPSRHLAAPSRSTTLVLWKEP